MSYEFTRKKLVAERRALTIQIATAGFGGLVAFMATKHRLVDGSPFTGLQVAILIGITVVSLFFAAKLWIAAWCERGEADRTARLNAGNDQEPISANVISFKAKYHEQYQEGDLKGAWYESLWTGGVDESLISAEQEAIRASGGSIVYVDPKDQQLSLHVGRGAPMRSESERSA